MVIYLDSLRKVSNKLSKSADHGFSDGSSLKSFAQETMTGVYHANEWGVSWGAQVVAELKEVAQHNERRRARLCLHPSPTDTHQEMLIVMASDAIEHPQRRSTGFDTKIALEGKADLQFYSNDGKRTRSVSLGEGLSTYVHTCTDEFHSLRILSDWFVFLEILRGPFDAQTTEFASWSATYLGFDGPR